MNGRAAGWARCSAGISPHAARNRGIRRFTATMASDNMAAHRLMAKLTHQLEQHHVGGGVDELVFDLAA